MKKVIYVEIDEEVASLYDRVKHLSQKTIYLVVPRKAILFQSLVNLKLLKTQFETAEKKLILVTTDPTGKHLAEQLGLEVAARVEVEKIEASAAEEGPEMQIRPIQARRNEVLRESPKRVMEKKTTISEFIQAFRLEHKTRKKEKGGVSASSYFTRAPRKFWSLLLVVSVGLFLLIGYIALPGATLLIRPAFSDLDYTVNVTLADKHLNQTLLLQNKPHILASETVTTVAKQTTVFNTTSQEFYGKTASGKVTIMNTAEEPWEFKTGTRLKTADGLIFRIPESVTVPAATADPQGVAVPGRLVVTVKADPFDSLGKPVGERGNVGPSHFIFPGLEKKDQARLWGESTAPMSGGTTEYRRIVKTEDIEAAKQQIKDHLIEAAKEELRGSLDSQNQLNHTHLVLLDDRRYLKTELLDLRLSEDLLGSSRDKFEVFAKIQAEGVAYDLDQLFAILKKEIQNRVHPDMQIREESLSLDNVHYTVIDEDPVSGLIKLTVNLKGIEEFVIDPAKDAGQRLGDRIKNKVLGMSVADAKTLINNFPEVDAVEIKTWPFWITTLPRLPENIQIKALPRQP